MGPIMINGFGSLIKHIRPNIIVGVLVIASLGGFISWLGYLLANEGIISAAGVGAIIGITNLCSKILERE